MVQITKAPTADRNYRGIGRGRLGARYAKKPADKIDLIVQSNISECDQNSTTKPSDTSNTNTSRSDNSATSFPKYMLQRLRDSWRQLVLCYDVNLERMQLSKITSEQLDDLGLDRLSVNHEARRGFFDIPSQRIGKLDANTRSVPQRKHEIAKNIQQNKGIITITLLGVVISIGILLIFGYVIALSVAAGFTGGSLVAWLTIRLRKYPNHYIDMRDTD